VTGHQLLELLAGAYKRRRARCRCVQWLRQQAAEVPQPARRTGAFVTIRGSATLKAAGGNCSHPKKLRDGSSSGI
jgi:hypothetical protein